MGSISLLKEPVVLCPALFCVFLLLYCLLSLALLPLLRWCLFPKPPPVAFFHIFFGGFRGCWYLFSSYTIRPPALHRLSMSGGCHHMQHPIEVTTEPALVPPTLNKFDKSYLMQE